MMQNLRLRKIIIKRSFPLLFKSFFISIFRPKLMAPLKEKPAGYDPKPGYEIPEYKEWMKIPEFNKNEKYLRPTKSCESTAP